MFIYKNNKLNLNTINTNFTNNTFLSKIDNNNKGSFN